MLEPLKLELDAVVSSSMWALEMELGSSERGVILTIGPPL